MQTQEGRAVPGPLLGATYMLKNVEHGSCWQLTNPRATTYTLDTCDKTNKLQQFIYRHDKHLENVHTNKCVDNDNELGHRLYQWKNGCTAGNKYQTWNLIGDDTTNYRYILYSGATLANKVPRSGTSRHSRRASRCPSGARPALTPKGMFTSAREGFQGIDAGSLDGHEPVAVDGPTGLFPHRCLSARCRKSPATSLTGHGCRAMNLRNDRGTGHGPVLVHRDPLAGTHVRPVGRSEGQEANRGLPAGLQNGHVLNP